MSAALTSSSVKDLLRLCIGLPQGTRARAREALAEAGFAERPLAAETPEGRRPFEDTVLARVTSQMLETHPEDSDAEILAKARSFIEAEGLLEPTSDMLRDVRIVRADGVFASYTYFDADALDRWSHSRGCDAAVDIAVVFPQAADLAPIEGAIRDTGLQTSTLAHVPPGTILHFGDGRPGKVSGVITVFRPSDRVTRIVGKRHDRTFFSVSSKRSPPTAEIEAAKRQASRR